MKLKLIGIVLSCVISVLSSCTPIVKPVTLATPTPEWPGHHPLITWQLTDDFSIRSQNFNMDILQIILTPNYIMLISTISGNNGMVTNIQQANVLNEEKQIEGQTKATIIQEFKQGKLIALTFFGQRHNMRKPLFSITALTGENNDTINGVWQIAPLELPKGAEDRDGLGMFAGGVASAGIGDVTIFSTGSYPSPICKGNAGIGGTDNLEAYFAMVVSENGKTLCLYTHVLKDGSVIAIKKEILKKIPILKITATFLP